MKAIEVKKGDRVIYNGDVCHVVKTMLNKVKIINTQGTETIVSYSQIEKYEQE